MTSISKNMLVNAIILGLFAIIGTAIVAFTFENTEQRIEDNRRNFKLKKLHELVPPDMHDNEIDTDTIQIRDPLLARGQDVMIYRARNEGKPVAAILETVAPDGYSGNIYILVAVRYDGTLAGVRVTEHLETPGLGDAIDARKSDWIHIFRDKSLEEPKAEHWRVRRDGGEFDQITSATITSRAIVKATHNVLKYFKEHRKTLFD